MLYRIERLTSIASNIKENGLSSIEPVSILKSSKINFSSY